MTGGREGGGVFDGKKNEGGENMMPEMTKEKAVEFFSEFYGGKHHIPGDVRENNNGWWGVAHYGELASYDYNCLTRLVFLAHDKCVRVAVHGCNGEHVRISIWSRDPGEECVESGHPTIEEALSKWRKNNSARENHAHEHSAS